MGVVSRVNQVRERHIMGHLDRSVPGEAAESVCWIRVRRELDGKYGFAYITHGHLVLSWPHSNAEDGVWAWEDVAAWGVKFSRYGRPLLAVTGAGHTGVVQLPALSPKKAEAATEFLHELATRAKNACSFTSEQVALKDRAAAGGQASRGEQTAAGEHGQVHATGLGQRNATGLDQRGAGAADERTGGERNGHVDHARASNGGASNGRASNGRASNGGTGNGGASNGRGRFGLARVGLARGGRRRGGRERGGHDFDGYEHYEPSAVPAVRREPRSLLGHGRRVIMTAAGVLLIVLGLVFASPFVPGPGTLTVLFGLGLLATEYDWAKDLHHWAWRKSKEWFDRARRWRSRRQN